MPKLTRLFLIFALMLGAVGCAAGTIRCSEIREIAEPVLKRHDIYARADQTEIGVRLRDERLRRSISASSIISQETTTGAELGDAILPCLEYHDGQVEGDRVIAPVEKRGFLRSSRIIREIIADSSK